MIFVPYVVSGSALGHWPDNEALMVHKVVDIKKAIENVDEMICDCSGSMCEEPYHASNWRELLEKELGLKGAAR